MNHLSASLSEGYILVEKQAAFGGSGFSEEPEAFQHLLHRPPVSGLQ